MDQSSVLEITEIITSTVRSREIVDQLIKAGQPIGLDAEGIELGPKGPVTLVQISTQEGQIKLFDVKSNPSLFLGGGLAGLLQSKDIVKVIHACMHDSGAFYFQHGIILQNVFDTQVADEVLQMKNNRIPYYKTSKKSFNHICEVFDVPTNPIKMEVLAEFRKDKYFWDRRPLTPDMQYYAACDVIQLVPNLYQKLKSALDFTDMTLYEEMVEETIHMYFLSPSLDLRVQNREAPVLIRALILPEKAGYVIGKAGATIDQINGAGDNAVIRFGRASRNNGVLRVLNAYGETCQATVKVLEAGLRKTTPSRSEPRSVMFLMNNHIVDIVFGRGAEKIQGICETKDVKVLISTNFALHSDDRVIKIEGSCGNMMSALQQIYDRVGGTKGIGKRYDPEIQEIWTPRF
ncbi:uncharacterized protein LOC111699617 [Eurytemora carolleeae]|uniref:uncharacterized protein LOC111699617 n=1 Tax=Eurytemora carolleeae TaxID=1294199 RepID=UPI000C759BFC|nr:uncharacterized protein LOC111699617 [Eurytemora carolleeae]|eukprot:XP_023326100.1 uncharacterized protein LOC111699617 [Eurytemora affinis]